MNDGMVSVVLPIYNVEQYLDRCIKSVVNQTYPNLEIILVDDGSPDHCPEICESWAKRDSRIKVIHKQNAGLGMARNTGIEHAAGEYICFLDSDDYIALDTIEKCRNLAAKEQAEIVTFGFSIVNACGKTKASIVPCPAQLVYSGKEVQEQFLPDFIAPDPKTGKKANLWMSAGASFYSMELIRSTGWRFVSEREIISEDVYSLLRLYKDVHRVAVLPEALYFYSENGTSLTHTYRTDRHEKINFYHQASVQLCRELNYTQEVIDRLSYSYASNVIGALKLIVLSGCSDKEQRRNVSAIVTDGYLQRVIHQMDIRREPLSRKLLLMACRWKCSLGVFAMTKWKTKSERHRALTPTDAPAAGSGRL